jgi:PHD/YefM family antitoxin component YafN of YafNO toxin-antitoxin module
MTTYSELVTQIRDYTETTSDVLSDTIVNDFIEHAEKRIFRDVDLDIFRSYQFATLTVGNPFVSLPGANTDNIAFVRSAQIYTSASPTRDYLEQKDITYMNQYWPNRDTTSKPKYYAMWDQDTLYLAPTPNSAYNIELALNKQPTGLSSSNTTTWVSTNAPKVILYAALCEAFRFLKGPDNMLQYYEQGYQQALQGLQIEQQGRRRRDEYYDGVLRFPLDSKQP